MTSPLPPRRRDTRSPWDLLRQDRTNLQQLNGGLMGGRMPALRPLPVGAAEGDFEDDEGEAEAILFLNTDSRTATVDGATVTIPLSHTPIDGSAQVFQNGVALAASEWHREGAYLTIPGQRWFRAGHKFWVDYAYIGDDEATGAAILDSLVLRGVTTHTGALPVETVAGDFVVIATRGGTGTHDPVFSDPRFPLLSTPGTEGQVYAGIATDLSPLAPVSGAGALVVVSAFVGSAVVDTVAYDVDPPSPFTVPAQPGIAAIAVINERSSFVAGSVSLPNMPPWLLAATDVQAPGWTQVTVCYWFDANATTTPAVTPNHSGGVDEMEAFIVTLTGVGEE